jgi:hypothetical protein
MSQTIQSHQKQGRSQGLTEFIDSFTQCHCQLSLFIDDFGASVHDVGHPSIDTRIILGEVLSRLAGSKDVERKVHGNPVEPGVRLTVALESSKTAISPNEGLLNHVLRLRGIPQHMKYQPEKTSLIPSNQGSEGLFIAFASQLNEFVIALHRHGQ